MTQEQVAKQKKKVEMNLGEYEDNIDHLWLAHYCLCHRIFLYSYFVSFIGLYVCRCDFFT